MKRWARMLAAAIGVMAGAVIAVTALLVTAFSEDEDSSRGSGWMLALGIADVAFQELDVGALEICPVARVGQLVEDDDLVAGRGQALGEVRADEAGPAGDEHAHRGKA